MALIERGLEDDPKEASLWRLHGQAMLSLGYTARATGDFKRAADLDPSDSRTVSLLYSGLVLAGRVPEARRLLDEGLARFPVYPHLWREKFVALLAEGRYAEAEAMASPSAAKPDRTFIGDPADLVSLARALESKRRADGDALTRPVSATSDLSNGLALRVWRLVLLGRIDEAYRAAAGRREDAAFNLEMYADTPFEAFRRDPRFLKFVADQSTLDQWRKSNTWPDFCRQPGWPYDCKAVAR
jgi:tetratricopeptide (TPR) repeat protein